MDARHPIVDPVGLDEVHLAFEKSLTRVSQSHLAAAAGGLVTFNDHRRLNKIWIGKLSQTTEQVNIADCVGVVGVIRCGQYISNSHHRARSVRPHAVQQLLVPMAKTAIEIRVPIDHCTKCATKEGNAGGLSIDRAQEFIR